MPYLNGLKTDIGKLIRAGVTSGEFAPSNIDVAASCFCASVTCGIHVCWSAFERARDTSPCLVRLRWQDFAIIPGVARTWMSTQAFSLDI